MSRLIRVFPRQTKATPDDESAFVGDPPLWRPEADEVHVSCTFTWDLVEARRLQASWARYYPVVKLGGPALDDAGGEFVPGRYLKRGYVITTRGCPNRCWFCLVPQREGQLRELPIMDGWNVLDNNLLAASRDHIERVFDMLRRQPHPAFFTGGFEVRRVNSWLVNLLKSIRVGRIFLAYDRESEKSAVERAIAMLLPCVSARNVCVYMLCGHPGDTIDAAAKRYTWLIEQGAMAFPMYFRDEQAKMKAPVEWRQWVRLRSRGIPIKEPCKFQCEKCG